MVILFPAQLTHERRRVVADLPVDCYERWRRSRRTRKDCGFFAPTSGVLRGGTGQEMEALPVISTLKPFFSHFCPWLVHQYRPIDHDRPNCWSFQGHGYHHQLNFNGKDHDESVNFGFPFWTYTLSRCCQFSGEVLSEFTPWNVTREWVKTCQSLHKLSIFGGDEHHRTSLHLPNVQLWSYEPYEPMNLHELAKCPAIVFT